MNEGTLVFFN